MFSRLIGILSLCAAMILLPSCGAGQKLVSIQVNPATVTFGSVNPILQAQLTAVGSYIHPPATKDITNQVTWTSDITQVAQVTNAGVVSPNLACGTANITATFLTNHPAGNIVTGSASVTVDGPSGSGCPSGP